MASYPRKQGSFTIFYENTKEFYDWYRETHGMEHPDRSGVFREKIEANPILEKLNRTIFLLEKLLKEKDGTSVQETEEG